MHIVAAAGHPVPACTHASFIHAYESLVSSKHHADVEVEQWLLQLGGLALSLPLVHIS